jgi:acetyl-CoA acetyltransferase
VAVDYPLKDRTAIVGVGVSQFARDTGRDRVGLAAEAFKNALDDAGLDKSEIDGLIVNNGPDCDRLAQQLGLEVEYAFQTWAHGRLSASTVQVAAMAVHAGLASTVACVRSIVGSSVRRGRTSEASEAFRPGSGPHWEHPQYGWSHQGTLAALSFRRYLHVYGGQAEQLGQVPVSQRAFAALNQRRSTGSR